MPAAPRFLLFANRPISHFIAMPAHEILVSRREMLARSARRAEKSSCGSAIPLSRPGAMTRSQRWRSSSPGTAIGSRRCRSIITTTATPAFTFGTFVREARRRPRNSSRPSSSRWTIPSPAPRRARSSLRCAGRCIPTRSGASVAAFRLMRELRVAGRLLARERELWRHWPPAAAQLALTELRQITEFVDGLRAQALSGHTRPPRNPASN